MSYRFCLIDRLILVVAFLICYELSLDLNWYVCYEWSICSRSARSATSSALNAGAKQSGVTCHYSGLPTAKRKVKLMTVEGTAFRWCAIRKHRINMFEFTSSNIEKTKPRNASRTCLQKYYSSWLSCTIRERIQKYQIFDQADLASTVFWVLTCKKFWWYSGPPDAIWA